jgi:hypothetical protein
MPAVPPRGLPHGGKLIVARAERVYKLYRSRGGKHGWHCLVCPDVRPDGTIGSKTLTHGGYPSQDATARAFHEHAAEPLHQHHLAEARRRLDERRHGDPAVNRVIDALEDP